MTHYSITEKARSPLVLVSLRSFIVAFALTIASVGAWQLSAQAIAGHNSTAPINYSAARTEYQDRQERIILSGDVDITQAGLRLQAQRILVNLSSGGVGRIDRLTATGGVLVTRGNESARGNNAIYDLNRRIITMSGDVSLRRGNDTINGGRLTIDLRTGISSVDGSAAGATTAGGQTSGNGRVSGTFNVPQN